MTVRINARIDAALARKLRLLREQTRKSTTEVVKASIESYYETINRQGNPAGILKELIGSGRGPADLSTNYKQQLTDSLAGKGRR